MTVDYTQFDAETPLSGQYISPTWQRDEDESDIAESLAHAFIAAVIVVKAWDWLGLARKWSDRGFRDGDLAPVKTKFTDSIKKAARDYLVKAAGLGRTQAVADFEAEFPAKDWQRIAATWASVYGNEMANQIADQSHKAIKDLVPQLINKGLRGDSLGKQVQSVYGLDPRSMNRVLNFLSQEKKPRNLTVLDIASELLTKRAKVIGDVQSFTGLNFGRQLTYLEAMDSGLLPKSARKVWVTAIDERVCKVCRPMDGVHVGLMDTFQIRTGAGDIRLLVPPVHPNCRCTVVPEERYRHGIITRRARFSDQGPSHRGRLRSEITDLVSLGKSTSFWEAAQHPRDHQGQFVAEVAGGLGLGVGGGFAGDEVVARQQGRRFVEGRGLLPRNRGGYWPNSVDKDDPIALGRFRARFKPNQYEMVRGLSLAPEAIPQVGHQVSIETPAHFSAVRSGNQAKVIAHMYATSFNGSGKRAVILHVPPGHGLSREVTNAKWDGVHGLVGDFKVARRVVRSHGNLADDKVVHLFLEAAKVRKDFDPAEARDDTGRWTAIAGKLNETEEPKYPFSTLLTGADTVDEEGYPTGEFFAPIMQHMAAQGLDPEDTELAERMMNGVDAKTGYTADGANLAHQSIKVQADFYGSPEFERMLREAQKDNSPSAIALPDFGHAPTLNEDLTAIDMESASPRSVVAEELMKSPQYRLLRDDSIDQESLRHLMGALDTWSSQMLGVQFVHHLEQMKQDIAAQYADFIRQYHLGAFDGLITAVEHAPANSPALMRGMVVPTEALDAWRPNSTFDLKLSSLTTNSEISDLFADPDRSPATLGRLMAGEEFPDDAFHSVRIDIEPGAQALHAAPAIFQTHQGEWITRGRFVVRSLEDAEISSGRPLRIIRAAWVPEVLGATRAVGVLKAAPVPEDNLLLMALHSSLPQAHATEVAKFSPLQVRDALGRFAPIAGAAAAAYVGVTNFPRVKDEQPRLPRHLRRVDSKIKSVKNGTYLVPRQYLDFHQRGQSFRMGNEAHINDMARVMRQSGYRMQPVTLHVYDNAVEVADGNHRVEAAYRAKIGFIPTKIVRMQGKKPVQRGVIPAWRQRRTNEARRLAASRYVGSLEETRRNPFRNLNQRLIAQDERKHQWHDKSRKRTIKPL